MTPPNLDTEMLNGASPDSQTELNGVTDVVLNKTLSLQQNASLIMREPKEEPCKTDGSNVDLR